MPTNTFLTEAELEKFRPASQLPLLALDEPEQVETRAHELNDRAPVEVASAPAVEASMFDPGVTASVEKTAPADDVPSAERAAELLEMFDSRD
jgi:hypothetical protein